MKKLIALMLVLALASTMTLSALAENGPAGGPPPDFNFGTLSLLNMTEEEYQALIFARLLIVRRLGLIGPSEGRPDNPPTGGPEINIVYYDTLDALLMALNAGDINNIEIYKSVARYLCAANDNLRIGTSFEADKTSETLTELVQHGINGNDFAFLMMEDNAALRDAFNAAIADMKADGTLERLVKEQIEDLINGGEIKPIALPKIDGAETIKVAVTGALPPMDYVAEDGTPAGFNTAVLAEIGSRIGRNIEIVVVDSLGRAAALASGTVDAVFWTRTNISSQKLAVETEAEIEAKIAENKAKMTEAEIALMDEVNECFDYMTYSVSDMPEGTIVTEPYFSDVLVPVMLAR